MMRILICLALTSVLFLGLIPAVVAQEGDAPAETAESPGPKSAEFQRVFTQWKDLLAELAILQSRYRDADQQERDQIKKEWNTLIEKGEAMKPKLIEAAEQAYLEAPNQDQEITRLLVDVLIGHVATRGGELKTDNYEEAFRLGKLLIDGKCEDSPVYKATAIAAYMIGELDDAEEYLKVADEKGDRMSTGDEMLDMQIQEFRKNPGPYKAAWAEELKIREAEAQADNLPRVLLATDQGEIELELFEDQAPNTVANFVSLVERGFYDGLTFHRVIPGFMAQGGCPNGDGSGGPGYHIPCECYEPDHRLHFRGSLSMAHAGRDTGGSQFFLTFVPTSYLDGKHTVFGRVIRGMEVLSKIQRRQPGPGISETELPKPTKIVKATVIRKRDHEYKPETLPEERPIE